MKTNILGLLMTLVVGVILAGALLAPVISEAQTTMGDPITKTNEGTNDIAYGIVSSTEITITNGTTVSVDGNALVRSTDVAYIFCTDSAFGWLSGSNSLIFIAGESRAQNTTLVVDTTKSATISAADGTLTVTLGDNTYTASYEWLLVPSANGEYVQALTLNDRNYYLDNSKDVIILGGDYTTGDLDTFYWYYNGETKAQDGKIMSVGFAKTLVDGTTDIYSGHPVVTITDGDDTESFTPYRTFVKENIAGHATAGASYSLLGAIPIMVIVAILMAAIGAIALRRAD